MTNVNKSELAISPKYFTANPNDSIQIYKGKLEIEHDKTKISFDGIIEFVWLRSPQITVSFTVFDSKVFDLFQSDSIRLCIPNCLEPVQLKIIKSNIITDDKGYRSEYYGRINQPICFGNTQNLSYVILHLVNFQDTLGDSIGIKIERGSKEWKGRFYLNANNWKITVDKAENFKSLFESLKNAGGYGITHTIKIEKNNGSPFDIEQLDNLKEKLFYFFSFARGFWIEPFFEVGFDGNGEQVWEKFSSTRTDKWQNVSSWFDRLHPERLTNFWTSFNQKLQDQIWEEPLKRAILLYISANQKAGEEEGSIILVQTAHELLSWTKFVSEKGLSKEGFDKLPASDKLRLLLSEAKIPLDTPSLLKFLPSFCRNENWLDGSQAVTGIRNKLVHPSPKNIQALQRVGKDEMQDAYILTMWYLELILLNLLGYKDVYANRLIYMKWVGQTENVPWI
jgi:hypothetical protein